jgi:hypothetical protein
MTALFGTLDSTFFFFFFFFFFFLILKLVRSTSVLTLKSPPIEKKIKDYSIVNRDHSF